MKIAGGKGIATALEQRVDKRKFRTQLIEGVVGVGRPLAERVCERTEDGRRCRAIAWSRSRPGSVIDTRSPGVRKLRRVSERVGNGDRLPGGACRRRARVSQRVSNASQTPRAPYANVVECPSGSRSAVSRNGGREHGTLFSGTALVSRAQRSSPMRSAVRGTRLNRAASVRCYVSPFRRRRMLL
jgi:hypothetical protein